MSIALGCHALDAFHEEVKDFRIVQALDNFAINLAEHQVPLLILEWVVETCLRAILQTLYEWSDFIHLSVRDLDQCASVKWVDEVHVFAWRCPLAINQVEAFVR